MKDIKHLIELASDKLLDWFNGIIISFGIISFTQVMNSWDLTNYVFIYYRISGLMDIVWWIDFWFTGISAFNWIIRKTYEFLNRMFPH